jgi:hypothetical protein
MERADLAVDRSGRVYERYGSTILAVSAIFGIVAAVITAIPPAYIWSSPFFENTYAIVGALGVASVGFYVFALVMTLVPFRRNERWAWFTLWMLPLLWLAQFVLATDLRYYLVLAIITAFGLILPYRRFFFRREEHSPRVS